MKYILNKGSYSAWFEKQFGEVCMNALIYPSAFIVVEIESVSTLSTPETEVVHVRAVAGSVGVLPGTGFATAKRCLKQIGSVK